MSVERVNSSQIPSKLPGGLPNWGKISSYIKQVVKAAAVKHRETEPFVVQETMLYTKEDYEKYKRTGWILDYVPSSATLVTPDLIGSVQGYFLNNKTKEIKGEYVKPLDPNVSKYPVRWEHVTVVEYNGQHYYKDVINYKNSPNENSAPFQSEWQPMNLKPFGTTFEQQDIRRVKVCEGEIVYEGRFGNSIKLGCNPQVKDKKGKPKLTANIKLRVGQTLTKSDIHRRGKPVNESIESDAASIYLLENGLPYNARTKTHLFEGEPVKGQKILLRSDGIFISGRTEFRLQVGSFIMIDSPNFSVQADKVNLGSRQSIDTQPVVKGEDLKEFLDELLTDLDLAFATAMATITPAGVIVTGGMAAPAPYKASIQAIKAKLKAKLLANKILSTKVRTT